MSLQSRAGCCSSMEPRESRSARFSSSSWRSRSAGRCSSSASARVAVRREPVRTGEDELVGSVGDVRRALDPIGQVFVYGALWRARAADGEGPIGVGYRVRVEAVDGLTLSVRPLEPDAKGDG